MLWWSGARRERRVLREGRRRQGGRRIRLRLWPGDARQLALLLRRRMT